ncbi:oligosaccharide repeat unit polymerase [Hyphomonas sp.]|uniref:oligosaccharide repeat unit polymerase n=1 Tax=Hyphomonas sp. TaxID=87 RepID=UPI0025C26E94|nr:oligosaccharide repeat unit polymerase [Hyphomonas sp.]MBI1399410.1 oligosaccharide repeat unit polymerase [Hyphomonas sp.]
MATKSDLRRSSSGHSAFLFELPIGLACVLFYSHLAFAISGRAGLGSEFAVPNILVAGLSLFGLLIGARAPFGLRHVFCLFTLILIAIVPLIEVQKNTLYHARYLDFAAYYPAATWLSLSGMVAFALAYSFVVSRKRVLRVSKERHQSSGSKLVLLILSSTAAVAILAYNNFNYMSVLFRGGELTTRQELSGPGWLIFQYFVYPTPAICAVIHFLSRSRKSFVTLILVLNVLLFNPPTGMARFQAAALYIALFAAAFPLIRTQRHVLSGTITFGLLFVFPLLDRFRRYSGGAMDAGWNSDFLTQGHFDGFQNFATVLAYQMQSGGRQLLGALLFFVPREIWEDKPVGSGAMLATELGFPNSNIAMNLFAEGYLNFGIGGVIGFLAILGLVCAYLDREFRVVEQRARGAMSCFYLFSFGLVFFVLRGDLLNGLAFCFGTLSATFLVFYSCRLVANARPRRASIGR